MIEDKDLYKILQVDPEAEQEVIESAYKRLARKYHPDNNKSTDATAKMQEINAAFDVLNDPIKRKNYDKERQKRFKPHVPVRVHQENKQPQTHSYQYESIENLVYQSDFYTHSDKWIEEITSDDYSFRQNGFYHISILRPNCERYAYPIFPVSDFRVFVEAQFVQGSGTTSECGIVFRLTTRARGDNYYRFAISASGYYSLYAHIENLYSTIINYQYSELFNRHSKFNELMVEMIGSKIRIGINGQILSIKNDFRLSNGNIGLLVSANKNDFSAEARFRKFKLFSI